MAIQHYQALLKAKPNSSDAPEFLYRIGKSRFYLFQFTEAVTTYEDLIQKYPHSKRAEKAAYEIGATYFTRGERQTEKPRSEKTSFQVAMEAYEKFMKRYPSSEWFPHARFGVASCLEELDELEDAYRSFLSLKGNYPSPHLIEVKLKRIEQRLAHRNSSSR